MSFFFSLSGFIRFEHFGPWYSLYSHFSSICSCWCSGDNMCNGFSHMASSYCCYSCYRGINIYSAKNPCLFLCLPLFFADETFDTSSLNKWRCRCSLQGNQSYSLANCSKSCDCHLGILLIFYWNEDKQPPAVFC